MFEKLATDLFVQLAAKFVPPLPSGATDAEVDADAGGVDQLMAFIGRDPNWSAG